MGREIRRTNGADTEAAAEGRDFVMACVGNDNDLRAITIGQTALSRA